MKPWLLAALPIGVGLAAALLINIFSAYNPVFYMRASLSVLVFLGGLILSILVMGVVRRQQNARQQQQNITTTMAALAAERRQFLQRLDHELKNPLTAIRTGLANMADAATSAERHQALETVQAQTMRLSHLTANLRKIADLETRPLEKTAVDLSLLLHELVELGQDLPEMAARQLTLSIPQAPWPLPVIEGDRDLLFLALYNLLENAVKFTQPGDTIELRAREDGRFVILEVADTGPGIDPRDLDHIWDELYRGTRTRHIPGSGLGLSLVKAIVERHHGTITAHSRPAQGTLMRLHLPTQPL